MKDLLRFTYNGLFYAGLALALVGFVACLPGLGIMLLAEKLPDFDKS